MHIHLLQGYFSMLKELFNPSTIGIFVVESQPSSFALEMVQFKSPRN